MAYVLYSVALFQRADVEEQGVEVCSDGKCFKTLHIHAELKVFICGEKQSFPKEEGELQAPHTHKESDIIHSPHIAVSVDERGNPTVSEGLSVGEFMKSIEWTFSDKCIREKCNGDACNGKPGKLSMTVNGQENAQFGKYVWKDDDEIMIRFE